MHWDVTHRGQETASTVSRLAIEDETLKKCSTQFYKQLKVASDATTHWHKTPTTFIYF